MKFKKKLKSNKKDKMNSIEINKNFHQLKNHQNISQENDQTKTLKEENADTNKAKNIVPTINSKNQ